MQRIIRKIPAAPTPSNAKRVAAYARVSSGKDAMLHSLSAQVGYYSELIQKHQGWQYAGVYADEAMTGTKECRENYQKLLSDCRDGKIDMIITKSISRFARNTVTLLETVRELKQLGIDVFFEEQNIHSLSGDGELMLTILASYAQEESRSVSENQKWRVKKNFESGKPWNVLLFGYKYEDEEFKVVPHEAEIVKRIFTQYLSGDGCELIAKALNEDGLRTRNEVTWSHETIARMLKTYTYTGNLMLQSTYRDDPITKRRCKNRGELPMYHAVNTHEPIISLSVFEAVQEEMSRRAEHFKAPSKKDVYAFTGKLVCSGCEKNYRRKKTAARPVWICRTFNTLGKAACSTSKQIPEATLFTVTAEVLGLDNFDEEVFENEIKKIIVGEKNSLEYVFNNGKTVKTTWPDRSRSESWTEEKREKARQQNLRRNEKCREQ